MRFGKVRTGLALRAPFTIFDAVKESKFVKTKMVAGYVLLIAVCVLAVGYVYRVVVRFSAPDSNYVLLQTKHSAVNRTLYHLYQAESYGQLMIAGYQSYEARYKRELRTVRGCIDSLRSLTGDRDSLQTMRLDSIKVEAKNEFDVDWYGFNPRLSGEWTVVDENLDDAEEPDDDVLFAADRGEYDFGDDMDDDF